MVRPILVIFPFLLFVGAIFARIYRTSLILWGKTPPPKIVTDGGYVYSILKKILLNSDNSGGNESAGHTTLFRRIVVDLLTFFADTYSREFGFENGPPIHDACAIAYVIMPEIFNAKLMHVDVICNELSPADGQTVCDIWGYKTNELQNVVVCDKMNVEVFFELCLLAIENCNRASPVNGSTTVVLG